jgi:short-subunit dehydrogenase
MKKNLIIVGMGPGLSIGIAEKFGQNGFSIGMISRNEEKLKGIQKDLSLKGITSDFATADAYDASQVETAVKQLNERMGGTDVLIYNAAALKMKALLSETATELNDDFKISVSNAYVATQAILPALKDRKGAILLTGGGFAVQPSAQFGSLSLGKAALRSLAYMLNDSLNPEGVFVGTVTINGYIQHSSTTHSPAILAEKYWELFTNRSTIEITI